MARKITSKKSSLPSPQYQLLLHENKELRRQLDNARKGLTCGLHAGMSCVEKHEADYLDLEEEKGGWEV